MISIIVAVAENNVIGNKNQLIWHISEDLKYFKTITTGHAVIMGRKTFESIGKALPNRKNIVITQNAAYTAKNCLIAQSLQEAIDLSRPDNEVFIIGGGSVYREAIAIANRIYLTRVHRKYEGDTFFPEINPLEWREIERKNFERGDKFEYPFSFIIYDRINS